MLHQIELPTYDGKLDKIVEYQRDFIAVVCNSRIPLTPQEDDFKRAFGNDEIGAWTYAWLQKKKKSSRDTYYRDLCALLTYLTAHPALRRQIIGAFKNDADFYAHKDDALYAFLFNTTLDAKTYKDLHRFIVTLMVAFYDTLFSSGFPAYLAAINRKQFIHIFWDTNKDLRVCPACDGKIPDAKERCHVDHFLPKSLYPFLSVRSANLVPICIECNVTKRDKDPLDQSLPGPLVNTFHPYARPALSEINIVVYRQANGERKILLEERTGGTSRRILLLNEIYKLEERWNKRLIEIIGSIRRKLRRYASDRRRKGWSATDIVESLLENEIGDDDIGKQPDSVIIHSYLNYALQNQEERLTLEGLIAGTTLVLPAETDVRDAAQVET